jgi:hypothetical protein
MRNCCVSFEVQTEFLNIIHTSFGFNELKVVAITSHKSGEVKIHVISVQIMHRLGCHSNRREKRSGVLSLWLLETQVSAFVRVV